VGDDFCLTSGNDGTGDVGGTCDVTIHSDAIGTTEVKCSTTVDVGGVSLTRMTGAGGPNGDNAIKHWEGRSITIVKDAIPDSHQDFEFSGSGEGIDPTSFFLDDNQSLVNGGDSDTGTDQPVSIAFGDLLPGGLRVISEINIPVDWALLSIICVDTDTGQEADVDSTVEFSGADPDPAFQEGDNTVSLTLSVGENVTCTYTNVSTLEGCTPGYWKNHLDRWPQVAGVGPAEPLGNMFSRVNSAPYGGDAGNEEEIGDATQLQALRFHGGSGLFGAARNLLRAAVASYLNAAFAGDAINPDPIQFPLTVAEVESRVNTALDLAAQESDESAARAILLAEAGFLDEKNNLGCPLGGSRADRSVEDESSPRGAPPVPTDRREGIGEDESGTPPPSSTSFSSSFQSSLAMGGTFSGSGTTEPIATEPTSAEASSPTAESEEAAAGSEDAGSTLSEPVATSEQQTVTLAYAMFTPTGQLEFSGVATDESGQPLSGVVGITFALYEEAEGGAPLWLETRNVELDAQGRYTVVLAPPLEYLAQAGWLSTQVQGGEPNPLVPPPSSPNLWTGELGYPSSPVTKLGGSLLEGCCQGPPLGLAS
jgi:hypothetical protein